MTEPNRGRVTIPTDMDVVPETLKILDYWGADAIRDCDGTDFPQQLKDADAKIYSTYYTTRKDNAWAKANPDEVQQCYIMTGFHTAVADSLSIPLMQGISPELMQVNTNDDITRWWEVMDRTTGQPVPPEQWSYADGSVTVQAVPFHEYTVSFLAYLIWDPVHMYNAVTNGWKNFEHQITFDVRQPKTHKYSMERLRKFIAEHPYVNVIRYTTFFHQFTLIFDELKREKFVDWYGYSASVSPYILNQFEQEVGYKFRPEYIIDQGYYNNQYRVPSKEFRDFQAFQRREVAKLAKEMVDITHELGKEAMMFLGDHWIGTEPFMEEFKSIGLDAVVGSVGNGSTLRLISDILDLSKIESNTMEFCFGDQSLHTLLSDIYQSQLLTMPPQVELRLELPQADTTIRTDASRLKQVINNLINNAAKFTDRGSITFGYRTDEGAGEVELFVRDTGKGISQEHVGRIFERFYKTDSNAKGVGLGLSICRTIIEILGGDISVVSAPGKGTCFKIVHPVHRTETAAETAGAYR